MKCIYPILLLYILFPVLLFSQDILETAALGDTIYTNVDLFEGHDPLVITLIFDMKKYQREKHEDVYIPVDMMLHINDTLDVEKRVRIKPRGDFRKNHCSLAPFWLNIRKADMGNLYLQEVVKMKVVTHCKGSPSYEDYVLIEYLAYKIYNILSPLSFRARLIKMKYVDTGRKDRVTEGWAFMIEPETMLAERNGGLVVKYDQIGMASTRQDQVLLVSLFQYMIGNGDYSVAGRHNIKLLSLPGVGTLGFTPVPYDFDYTGLVNAYYAKPGEKLGIEFVTERYFLGPCAEDQAYRKTIQYMEEQKGEIMKLLNSFPYLDGKVKKRVIAYIEGYYISAKSPYFIEKELRSTCR